MIQQCSECGRTGCKITRGLCPKHYSRLLRHGDVHTVKQKAQNGPANSNWRDNYISYRTAHDRVGLQRGRASQYPCVDCGGRATHWSYDHTDPDELSGPLTNGRGSMSILAWSADPNRYEPRCPRCHKAFDKTRSGPCGTTVNPFGVDLDLGPPRDRSSMGASQTSWTVSSLPTSINSFASN